ncbi:vacuolar fusion protein ccz1 [Chamberlinius hualienensis]
MSEKSGINLERFYIFNSTFGPREGEEYNKIFYYYPPDTDKDEQVRSVGFCEAMVKFTETFNPSKQCESLHTQKTKQFLFRAEEQFWLIMNVSIPFSQISKDGQHITEYKTDDVQDSIFHCVLRLAYLVFRLFHGSFYSILRKSDVITLKQKLTMFFTRYLSTLKLSQSDILDIFNGVSFLPLDKNSFLKIHCLANLIETTFPSVKYVAFLYSEQLVWSGLEQEDIQILYKYLVSNLFPNFLESELRTGQFSPNKGSLPFAQSHYGRYVTGPVNLSDQSNLGKVPKIHVNVTSTGDEECNLVVYRALSASVCLLVDPEFDLTLEFYKKLDSFLGPHLTSLASSMAEVYSKNSSSSSGEQQFKYVYFNHNNRAQRTTMHTGSSKCNTATVPQEVTRLLTDINSDLKKSRSCGEIFVKSMNDNWAIGKKSDGRELYVYVNQKNANLMEANDELCRLCSTSFDRIFYPD